MSRKVSLYFVVVIQITVQVIGITSLVGYLSYRSGKQAVEKMADQLMTEKGEAITHELDHYLNTAQGLNQAHIAAVESGTISLDNLDQLHRYLIGQHRAYSEMTTLLFGDRQGDFLTIHRVDDLQLQESFTQLNEDDLPLEAGRSNPQNPSQLDLYAVQPSGDLGRQLSPIQNLDVRDRPWFRQAVETGKAGWTEPFQIGTTNVLAINVFAPFFDAKQQLKGVFSVNVSLENLNLFLESLPMGKQGQIFIIERNGLFIADSSTATPYLFTPEMFAPIAQGQPGIVKFRRLSAQESENPIVKMTAEELKNRFGDLTKIQEIQHLQISVEGDRQFLEVQPYQNDSGLDWLIVSVVPQSQFLGAIEANLYRTLGLCAFSLVSSLGLALWTSRRLGRSLSRLTQATQNLAQGEFHLNIAPTRIQEIHTLNQTFQEVAGILEKAEILRQNYTEQLEAEVAEKTNALTEAQRVAHVGSWEFYPATEKALWSDELYRIYEADEYPVDRPDLDIFQIYPEDLEHYQQEILNPATERKSFNADIRIITQKGNIRHIHTKGNPVYNDHGEFLKMIGIAIDISDRKQIELDLQRTTEELNNFFGLALDLLCIVDLEGHFLRLNGQWEKTLGYTLAEIQDHSFLHYIHPEDLSKTAHAFDDLKQDYVLNNFSNRYLCQDGSFRWIEWQAVLNGDIIYAAARDITEQKQQASKLIEAKDAAEAAAIAKGMFLATMSHEIRTPMNGVLGMLYLLQMTELDEQQQSHVNVAQSSAESLLGLINDILDFSKIEAGKLDLENVDFDLRQQLQDFTTAIAMTAQGKNLQVTLDLQPPEPVIVKGDASRLRQILTNLVGNAIKFTEQGEITIQACLADQSEDWLLTVTVRDTGIGIPPEKLTDLFAAFTQVDASTTRKYGGTGLGLAITKQLCALMGGDIRATSEVGQGSCFEFAIVLGKSKVAPEQWRSPEEPIPLCNQCDISAQTKILVVDDTRINHLVFRGLVKKLKFSVDGANDGKEALRRLMESPLDAPYTLIFMDCLMPEMDGYEATRQIRAGLAGDRYRDIPIIAMTANAMKGEKDKCLAVGMNDYLSKPIVPNLLTKILNTWTVSGVSDTTQIV